MYLSGSDAEFIVYSLSDFTDNWHSKKMFCNEEGACACGPILSSDRDDIIACHYDSIYHYSSIPVGFDEHPNPFTTRLSLTLPSSASIYSVTGTLIKILPKGKQEIDTRNWKAGVYIIKAGNETKRVVKLN